MAQKVVDVHASSSNHIKIITKLQSNQYTESPEVWLNRSPTTRDKNNRSPHTNRRGGEAKWPGPTIACDRRESGGLSWLQSPFPLLRSWGS